MNRRNILKDIIVGSVALLSGCASMVVGSKGAKRKEQPKSKGDFAVIEGTKWKLQSKN